MSADDMPVVNTDSSNRGDCSKQDKQGDSYSQNGNHGIGHNSGGVIKDHAKVAGQLEENNNNQSQNTNIEFTVNIDSQTKTNISKTSSDNDRNNLVLFEMTISGELLDENEAEYEKQRRKIENIIKKLRDLGEIKYNFEIKYVKKGSIKIGLEGHPEDFNKLQELFKSGELSEILGIPVEDISLVVDENLDDNKKIENKEKFRLIKEIRNRGAEGRNLSGADLRGADLSNADLRGADLSNADLSVDSNAYPRVMGVDSDAYPRVMGVDSDAYPRVSFLYSAYPRGADLSGANLSGADLRSSNLSNADLSGADLSGANLSNAKSTGGLLDSIYGDDDYLRGADLRDANLRGANLSNANLSSADLRGADLSSANLSNANLSSADLRGANLSVDSGAYPRDGFLSFPFESDADLSDANPRGADLRDANLRDADLRDANLRDANLRDAIVENARFSSNSQGISDLKPNLIERGAIIEDPIKTYTQIPKK